MPNFQGGAPTAKIIAKSMKAENAAVLDEAHAKATKDGVAVVFVEANERGEISYSISPTEEEHNVASIEETVRAEPSTGDSGDGDGVPGPGTSEADESGIDGRGDDGLGDPAGGEEESGEEGSGSGITEVDGHGVETEPERSGEGVA